MTIQEPLADQYRACHCCGLIHRMPNTAQNAEQSTDQITGTTSVLPPVVACCTRCQTWLVSPTPRRVSASRTAAASLGAFILFWPAILLPILQIEQLGQSTQQSILSGIIDLFRHGSYFVGGVVLLFSIIFPLTKIVLLMELSCLEWLGTRHKAFTLRMMEHAGKWSMMDVMLLALLVMLVKLGNLVHFEFGPAVVAFVACVAMSMTASLSFDPHSIWETA